MLDMKRRNFIIAGSAVAVAISIPSICYFLNDDEYDAIIAEPVSLSMILDSQSISALGELYRRRTQKEDSKRRLVRSIMKGKAGTGKELMNELDETIKSEFGSGQTVIIDGWILSVTEARQCALFSINQNTE